MTRGYCLWALGRGLLESVYERVLVRDLRRGGLTVERQRAVVFEYDGMIFEKGPKVDLLVHGAPLMKEGIHRVARMRVNRL